MDTKFVNQMMKITWCLAIQVFYISIIVVVVVNIITITTTS